VPLPNEEADEDEMEISDEDVEFVRQHGESLGFLTELNKEELDTCVHAACVLSES
jgi:hypothetical protein